MKRKISHKLIVFVLTAILCFSLAGCSGCSGCRGGSGGGGGTDATVKNPVTEPEQHLVEGTLHEIKLTPNSRVFVTANGESDYQVLLPQNANANEQAAAQYLVDRIVDAMRVRLPIVTETPDMRFSEQDKYLAVGNCELFEKAGLTMTEEYLGDRGGVYIVSKGNSVFIRSNTALGVEVSTQMFMQRVFGMEIYSSALVEYDVKAGEEVTLPDVEITERPDFDYITTRPEEYRYDKRSDWGDMFIPTDKVGDDYHNTFTYYNDEIRKAHPGWVSDKGNQLCYSAHGVTEGEHSLDAMLDYGVNEMMRYAEACPERNNFSFTHQDNEDSCDCETCAAERQKYGVSSAVLIKFVNKMAEKVNARLEAEFEKGTEWAANGDKARKVKIFFFAYNATKEPPAKKVGDAWQPIDESVKCNENVGVIAAMIKANFTYDLYDEHNRETYDIMMGWAACADTLTTWLYDTNFNNYMYPFNSYEQAAENYRFCKSIGSIGMFNQGIWNDNNRTHFSWWKAYRNVNLSWDVNQDIEALRKKYFNAMFRDAAEYMDKMYTEILAHTTWIRDTFEEINGGLYEDVELQKFWPRGVLDRFNGYIADAYTAIQKYRETDSRLYDILERNIKIESIFPRFATIRLYGSYYSHADLAAMKASFKKDFEVLKFYKFREFVPMNTITADW